MDSLSLLYVRKYALSSCKIFFEYAEEFSPEAAVSNEAHNFSLLLREQLRLLFSEIELHAEAIASSDNQNESSIRHLESHYDTVRNVEMIWHICEIFFFSNGSPLLLINWLKGNHQPVFLEKKLENIFECSSKQPESSTDYPDLLIDLTMHGRLHDLAEALSLHSAVQALSVGHLNEFSALCTLLRSHPYALVTTWEDEGFDEVPPESIDINNSAMLLRDWQMKCERVLMASAFLSSLSEVVEVFKILSGDREAIARYSRSDWSRLLVAQFLYIYPPQVSRVDIAAIVEEAIEGFPVDISRSASTQTMLLSVIKGDVGPALRHLYELSGHALCARTVDAAGSSLAALLSVALLSYLLATGGGVTGLFTLLPETSNGCCFSEELLLQVAALLNVFDFPVETVTNLLRLCPTKGVEFARTILPRRLCATDIDAAAVSRALRSLGCDDDADIFEITRGVSWLRSGSRAGIVRAFLFFQLAGDHGRSLAILDRALWASCMGLYSLAVADAAGDLSTFPFSGLALAPGKLRLPLRPQMRSLDEAEIGNLEAFWPGMDTSPGKESDYVFDNVLRLLDFAEGLLDVVQSEFVRGSFEVINLREYCSAVRSALKVLDIYMEFRLTTSQSVDEVTSAGTSRRLEQLSSIAYSELASAGNRLVDLIITETLPMRYWLHVLDLACWINREARGNRNLLDLDKNALTSTYIEGLERKHECLFSKSKAYSMIQSLTRMEAAYSSSLLFADVSISSLQNLRTRLLEVFAAAVVEENSTLRKSNNAMKPIRGCAASDTKPKPVKFGYNLLTPSPYF